MAFVQLPVAGRRGESGRHARVHVLVPKCAHGCAPVHYHDVTEKLAKATVMIVNRAPVTALYRVMLTV